MSDWKQGTLGDWLDFRNGAAGNYDESGPFPVFGANGPYSWSMTSNLREASVVVGRVGSYCGSVHYAPSEAWVSENALVATPKALAATRYWAYALRSANLNDWRSGSGQPLLNQSILRGIPWTAPPLPEQQAIADVLGALDDKIAANTRTATTADEYASSVLRAALGSERVRLDSLARITMGSSPRGEDLNEEGDGVPFYQGVRDFGFRFPSRRVFTTAPVRLADEGDVLVSVRAPVGEVNLADEPLCIGRGLAAVTSPSGKQATLLHQLKAEREAWEPYEAEGTVFGSINRDQLRGLLLRPVINDRADIVEAELASIEALIKALLAENSTLAATRDVLLPQLMAGKLRVHGIGSPVIEAEA